MSVLNLLRFYISLNALKNNNNNNTVTFDDYLKHVYKNTKKKQVSPCKYC